MTAFMHSKSKGLQVAAAVLVMFASFIPVAHAAGPEADAAASAYVDSVRAALNRGKRFPTGRDVSQDQATGKAEVTFALTRKGKVTSAKITQSSNSIPIDDQARALVRRAKYPAFPAAAFADEPTHTFIVAYNFTRSATGAVTIGEPVEVKSK